jgi:bifunctional non-homologous end joining protein LigD
VRPVFVRPCIPVEVARPPQDEDWIHEPKFDGYRFQIVKNGREVRLFSKSGAEYGARLPRMEAFEDLPAGAAVLDGELVFFDAKGRADFRQLHDQMRTRWLDETQLVFMTFDLLHENGVDLRGCRCPSASVI